MSRVYFAVINNRIMVTVEAENQKLAKYNMRAKLKELPVEYVDLKILMPGSAEAAEAVQHCEVISQAELGLICDSYISAKGNIAIANEEVMEARSKLMQARHELREAKEREKEHIDWFGKKARELGLPDERPDEFQMLYDALDEDEEDEEEEEDD